MNAGLHEQSVLDRVGRVVVMPWRWAGDEARAEDLIVVRLHLVVLVLRKKSRDLHRLGQ